MPEARFFTPRDLGQALALLAEPGESHVLAGGTDLMIQLGRAEIQAERVIDISRLAELTGINASAADGLELGALSRFHQLANHPLVAERAPMLAEAANGLGSYQTQVRATLGGNLARGSSVSDSLPVLLAHDSGVVLDSHRDGERRCSVETFLRDPAHRLRRAELIRTLLLNPLPAGSRWCYRKVAPRRAQAIAKLLFAGVGRVDASGRIDHLRLAAGGVAPQAIRLRAAEAVAMGQAPGQCAAACAMAVKAEIQPIDDLRSSADYRQETLARLVRRFLADLATT